MVLLLENLTGHLSVYNLVKLKVDGLDNAKE